MGPFFSFFMVFLCSLLSMAFCMLFERKFLAHSQVRKGFSKVGGCTGCQGNRVTFSGDVSGPVHGMTYIHSICAPDWSPRSPVPISGDISMGPCSGGPISKPVNPNDYYCGMCVDSGMCFFPLCVFLSSPPRPSGPISGDISMGPCSGGPISKPVNPNDYYCGMCVDSGMCFFPLCVFLSSPPRPSGPTSGGIAMGPCSGGPISKLANPNGDYCGMCDDGGIWIFPFCLPPKPRPPGSISGGIVMNSCSGGPIPKLANPNVNYCGMCDDGGNCIFPLCLPPKPRPPGSIFGGIDMSSCSGGPISKLANLMVIIVGCVVVVDAVRCFTSISVFCVHLP